MSTRPATPELEHFVRHRLGCTCPAEVFEQVDDAPSAPSRTAGIDRRIAIGGRLLIYIVAAASERAAHSKMADWIRAGLAERDALGMNRLRLVLVMDELTGEEQGAIEATFERLIAETDDRVHLHLLDTASASDLASVHQLFPDASDAARNPP
ncbi:hypothetical protein G3480_09440 [Thiorhodococcus mannitoliphagus]|uniref:Uncharacterized protein n=1 Tax=Thiorhodococcus mannitoliphagus TaxID=329406 RepID=A0A6P1DST2_9GAMM|nr:hypothetical protein [Thiorhodococcus mannitoliphagus]NEX20530.1 hypothetical protein [Thiorhodococcus mannitoliphagus]